MALGVASGCSTTSAPHETWDPSPWDPDLPPEATSTALLTPHDVSTGVETWLPYLLALDIPTAQRAYLDISASFGADPTCPAYLEEHEGEGYQTRYWGYFLEDGSCTTSDGAGLNAYGEEYFYDQDAAHTRLDWTELLLEGRITSPEGYALFGYTYLDDYTLTYGDGSAYWYRGLLGDLDWSGPLTWSGGSVAGTWLEAGYGARLEMSAYKVGDHTKLSGVGSLDHLPGAVSAISIQDFLLSSFSAQRCALEPTGALAVADEAGSWYDVVFDAPSAAAPELPADQCDGCGELWFDTTSLGTVCFDFAPLVGWDTPW